MTRARTSIVGILATLLMAVATPQLVAQDDEAAPPAPPSDLTAGDHGWDNGTNVDLKWTRSPDDNEKGNGKVTSYAIYRTLTTQPGLDPALAVRVNAAIAAINNNIAGATLQPLLDSAAAAMASSVEQGAGSDAFREAAGAAADAINAAQGQGDGDMLGVRDALKTVAGRIPSSEIGTENLDRYTKAVKAAKTAATKLTLGRDEWDLAKLTDEERTAVRQARAAAEAGASFVPSDGWTFVSFASAGEDSYKVDKLERGESYRFRVTATINAVHSSAIETTTAVAPSEQWFEGGRLWLMIIAFSLCGAVVFWIVRARAGKPIRVRKIGGLEAVDEAVGRATEMGRSCLFVPGIQDMNDIQTIAGITVLARVAKTAAEYDARVEVPTSRSLVMTTARETVQASFLAAGRPDAYNNDLIYYVTDEQFGYVAYLSGMMVREKPAACFYMGSFFAESLILAETGNSIGAIQIAGTAQPAQLPFFVAACDYTLIGEEFFAASAYLSGSPEELGSLKGQDVGKVIVAVGLLIGVGCATLAVMTNSAAINSIAEYIRNTILT